MPPSVPQGGVGGAEDAGGEQARVTGATDGDRGHRDTGGHLHDREQGIHTVEVFQGTGTPMTGSGVAEATMPGRCAAPPAPAMMTSMPRPAASRA